MRFYQLVIASDERWTLSIGRQFQNGDPIDIWAYSRCERLSAPQSVPFVVRVPGVAVDYNPTAFGSIVVSRRMADLVERFSPHGVQRIPAIVDAPGQWEVLNILDCVDYIDYAQSVIQYFPADHPENPGKPRGIAKLLIDANAAGERHIFRAVDWQVVEIVSETIKQVLDESGIMGIEYWPVTA